MQERIGGPVFSRLLGGLWPVASAACRHESDESDVRPGSGRYGAPTQSKVRRPKPYVWGRTGDALPWAWAAPEALLYNGTFFENLSHCCFSVFSVQTDAYMFGMVRLFLQKQHIGACNTAILLQMIFEVCARAYPYSNSD